MASTTMRRIVAFGDSLTQQGFDLEHRGWVAQLSHRYARCADVLNRGYSGYTTRWARELFDDAILPLASDPAVPTLVLIFFGANDCSTAQSQAVPCDEYRGHLVHMARSLLAAGPHVRVAILTPPTVDEGAWAAQCEAKGCALDRTAEGAGRHAGAARQAAADVGCPCVDLYAATTARAEALGDLASLFTDGLHLAAPGNDVVAAAVAEAVRGNFPGWTPLLGGGDRGGGEPLPPTWPYWGDIDPADPAASFEAHRAKAANHNA